MTDELMKLPKRRNSKVTYKPGEQPLYSIGLVLGGATRGGVRRSGKTVSKAKAQDDSTNSPENPPTPTSRADT